MLVGRQISRRARPSTAFCRKFVKIARQNKEAHFKNSISLFTLAGVAARLICTLRIDLKGNLKMQLMQTLLTRMQTKQTIL